MIFDGSTYCPLLGIAMNATAEARLPIVRDSSTKLVSAVYARLQIASSDSSVSVVS